MKAIFTKYLAETNTKPSRIKAYDGENSITISKDSDLSSNDPHKNAAIALCKKLGWHGTLHGGHTKEGMVFVFDGSISFIV